MIKRIVPVLLMVVMTAASAAAARYVWVASEGAELKKAPKGSAAVVDELNLDERLSVLKRSGRWYSVKTDNGRTGWIYRGKISSSKPARDTVKGAPGLFGSLDSDIASNKASTDRAMRGLSPEAEAYADETGTPRDYQRALDSVMEFKVTQAEVTEFLKKGKIGEFAQ